MIFKVIKDEAEETGYSIQFAHGYFNKFKEALSEAQQYGLSGKAKLSFAFKGFSEDEKTALNNYNELLKQGVSSSDAMSQALSNTTQAAKNAAIAANGNAVALKGESVAATTAAGATKLLYNALGMLGNIVITAVLTAMVQGLIHLINLEEETRKAHEETAEKAQETISKIEQENESLDKIINQYQRYKDILALTDDQKDELKKLQEEYVKTFQDEAKGIDLVNKKYEENIALMRAKRSSKAEENKSAYQEARRSQERTLYDNKEVLAYRGSPSGFDVDQDELFKKLEEAGAKIRNISAMGEEVGRDVVIPKSNSLNESRILSRVYDILDEYYKHHEDENIGDFLSAIQEKKVEREKEYEKYRKTLIEEAKNFITSYSFNENGSTYYYDNIDPSLFKEYYNGLIDKIKTEYSENEAEFIETVLKETLESLDISDYFKAYLEYGDDWPLWLSSTSETITESIVTFNTQFDDQIKELDKKHSKYQETLKALAENPDADLADFYKDNIDLAQYDSNRSRLQVEIFKKNAEEIDNFLEQLKKYKENLIDENGQPIEEDQKKIEGIISQFENWKYLDNVSNLVKQVVTDFGTLKDTADKLVNGDYDGSDLQSLFESFPELQQYSGDIKQLAEKAKELGKTKAADMLVFLDTLKETATDPKIIKALEANIAILQRLNFNSQSWLEYETGKIDDIIDGIELENDKLQEQLDIVDKMISKYEAASSAIQKYIDEQVKALENEKQAIEDDYDAQIKAIEDKNKEREQEINLQEKLDALLNAKKKRVNLYSETNGWKLQRNSSDIAEKQREYEQAVDEKKIADLEKERDSKTAVYDEQIKEWNDYKDKLTEKIEKIENVVDEKKAAEVLGIDWRDKIKNKDKALLNNLLNNYDVYLNKNKFQLEKEKEDNDSRIKLYQNLKNAMVKAVNKVKIKNNEYLDSLENIRLNEITNYQQREAYLKDFLKTQDDLLKNSNYGEWLLGNQDTFFSKPVIDGTEVIYKGADLLLNTPTKSMIDKMKLLETRQGIVQDMVNATNTAINKYDKRTNSNNFQFFGNIVTNQPTDFMKWVQNFVKKSKSESLVGK